METGLNPVNGRRDGDTEREQDERGEGGQHRPARPAELLGRIYPLSHRPGPADLPPAAKRAFPGHDEQAEHHQH
jgi:hypothetical protein